MSMYQIHISRRFSVVGLIISLFLTVNLLRGRFDKQPKQIADPYEGPYAAVETAGIRGFLPLADAKDLCARRRWNVYSTRDRPRKVYDPFLISTEMDWLEIRLHELDAEVDYFVVLESATTFQQTMKPLYLTENWQRFAKFHHKIIHQVVDFSKAKLPKDDTWEQERFTRNALFNQALLSLSDAQKPEQGDVLLVSDIDEIPRLSTIQALRNCAFPPRVTLRSHFYYYSFQWLHRGPQWHHPQATYFNGPKKTIKPEDLRQGEPDAEIYNAGWHCSSAYATMEDLKKKITSFSHKGYNQPYFLDSQRLLRHVRHGEDLFERESEIFDRVDDNPDIPFYLRKQENREKYAYMIDRDPANANFKDT